MAGTTLPCNLSQAVTLSDSVDLPRYRALQGGPGSLTDWIYVGSTGDVVVVQQDGTAVTYAGVPTGQFLPVAARRINSTSTTASSLVALYMA